MKEEKTEEPIAKKLLVAFGITFALILLLFVGLLKFVWVAALVFGFLISLIIVSIYSKRLNWKYWWILLLASIAILIFIWHSVTSFAS